MNRLLHFLQYHNAVPIALGLLFLGAGATFAATNPQALYTQTQTSVSVDNTYLANKDLSTYTPRAQIVSVTEDTEHYYVGYNFSTIDVENYVWRDVHNHLTLAVPKSALGEKNLAAYVSEQLSQNVDHERDRLKESQEIARRSVTQKTVAVAYGGLIGAFLDDTTETLPGYTPPIEQPVLPAPQGSVAVSVPTNVPVSSESGLTREQVAQMIEQRVNELLIQQTSPVVPTPVPEPTPTPDPVPETPPAPEPTPEPTPTPDPAPESVPVSEPTPEPAPEPTPPAS